VRHGLAHQQMASQAQSGGVRLTSALLFSERPTGVMRDYPDSYCL